ncbi:MAG: hypothetical protein HYZ29_30005 [Myxococcales bacterium]|nr:hypothetical protein [Myxococcales bacterium]
MTQSAGSCSLSVSCNTGTTCTGTLTGSQLALTCSLSGASGSCTATVSSTAWTSGSCSLTGLPPCGFSAAKS